MKRCGAILWSVFLLNTVVAEDKFPPYPVKSATLYSSCQTKNKIRVAIEPISEREQQKKHFDITFESQGFLPVLVVLENGADDGSLLLQRDLVTYHIKDDQTKGNSTGSPVVGSKAGQSVTAVAMVAVATASALGIAVPAMFIGLKMIAAASKVKQNILVQELRTQTIPSGKAGSGILYLPIGKPGTGKRVVVLNIPLSITGSQEHQELFTFELEVNGSGKEK